MPFKRPMPARRESFDYSSRSQSPTETPSKRSKVRSKVLPDVKLYIVQAKLDSTAVTELSALAEQNCEILCTNAEDADVIVTAITMRKRLERHISWDVAVSKAIVTPHWLHDSVREGKALPCDAYIAIQDLRAETIANCPTCRKETCECEDSAPEDDASEGMFPSPPPSVARGTSTSPGKSKVATSSKAKETTVHTSRPDIPAYLLPPLPPISTDLSRLSHSARYACQRASPLVCPNQALCAELDIIKRSRAFEGEERSALSYAKAIATIKAYPRRIIGRHQVEKLPQLGPKILGLIEEFIDYGKITEARAIVSSERFTALSVFTSIYGIGPTTARRLYALGLRTLAHLEAYYGVMPDAPEEPENTLVELEHRERLGSDGDGAVGLGESWVKIALGLREDLAVPIPRDEVAEMGRVVMRELDGVQPGCTSTIVGGYRRGKPESNDVDIVFTHPDPTKVPGLCKRLVRRLYQQGMVTHVMHLSSFHSHNPLRTTSWDSLEKSLTVFVLPPESPFHKGTRRRLDLIFAPPEVYWCAVVGWSGSIMFQRDLRLWAKDKCQMKFDSSGITRRRDSKPFFPKSEKAVFDLLGLEWMDPTWRNADA